MVTGLVARTPESITLAEVDLVGVAANNSRITMGVMSIFKMAVAPATPEAEQA